MNTINKVNKIEKYETRKKLLIRTRIKNRIKI